MPQWQFPDKQAKHNGTVTSVSSGANMLSGQGSVSPGALPSGHLLRYCSVIQNCANRVQALPDNRQRATVADQSAETCRTLVAGGPNHASTVIHQPGDLP
jgi:hypothetical protein